MARYDPLPYVRPARERNLRLADLYLRQGEQQAESERRRGEIQAQLWGNVGNIAGQTGAAIVQAPQQARDLKIKEAAAAQDAKLRGMQIGEAERTVNDRENFDLAMTAGSRQKTLEALKDRPELYEKAQAHFTKIDESLKQLMTNAAAGIADFGYTPEAAKAALDDLEENGFDPRKLATFREAFKNPEQIRPIVDRMLGVQPKPLMQVAPDATVLDPNTNQPVFTAPSRPAPPRQEPNPTEASLAMAAAAGDPAAQKALSLLKQQHATPQSDNEPLVPVIGPDGKPIYARRSDAVGKNLPAGAEKPSSGVQKHTLNFFNRARQADQDLEALEPTIQKMGLMSQGRMQWAPNFLQSDEGQLYTQAQRAFTEARLRKDSGAAIPPQEFENDRRTYFAQPGDNQATLEQKRRARATVLASLGFESGQALGEFLGDGDEAAALIQNYKTRAAKSGDDTTPLKNGATVKVGGFTVRVKP